MRKFLKLELRMLAAALAMVVLLCVPAMAADVDESIGTSNSGDYAGQCSPSGQTGNVGNVKKNAPEFIQEFGSEIDDFDSGGSSVSFGPSASTGCSRTVSQSSGGANP